MHGYALTAAVTGERMLANARASVTEKIVSE